MKTEQRGMYSIFKKISLSYIRICYLFLLFFNIIWFIVIPLVGLAKVLVDPQAAMFDLLIGAGITVLIAFLFYSSKSRLGVLFSVLGLAYWYLIPGNWLLTEWKFMQYDFALPFYVLWVVLYFLVAAWVLGILIFIGETIHLIRNGKSWFLGPWFDGVQHANISRLSTDKKRMIRTTLIFLIVAIGVAIPGVLSFMNVYNIEVTITPQDYDITYSFWAAPNRTAEHSFANQTNLGLDQYYYNSTVQSEMNEHKVNLDLTFGSLRRSKMDMLVDWETNLPDITYRIVLSPGELSDIFPRVFEATELLMEYEDNGTLDQWRGFAFDIEGESFQYNSSFDSYEESVGMWNAVFDYVEKKSLERNQPPDKQQIEMVSISDYFTAQDIRFDGDPDQQVLRQFNTYTPDRFTTYAPMMYRCQGPTHDETSYSFYSQLYTLSGGVPAERLGAYVGYTGASCYSMSQPQTEPYSWPISGPNTGFTNLMRDVLICKHFGVKEVTFFLAWTHWSPQETLWGAFDEYGPSFLDDLNDTVNGDPPESFKIYYNQEEAKNTANIQQDWLLDMARVDGILEMIGLWAGSIIIVVYIPRLMKKKSKER